MQERYNTTDDGEHCFSALQRCSVQSICVCPERARGWYLRGEKRVYQFRLNYATVTSSTSNSEANKRGRCISDACLILCRWAKLGLHVLLPVGPRRKHSPSWDRLTSCKEKREMVEPGNSDSISAWKWHMSLLFTSPRAKTAMGLNPQWVWQHNSPTGWCGGRKE